MSRSSSKSAIQETRVRRADQQTIADRTRTRLIEAAGEVFAEVGYQAATIRRICSIAEANVAAVNYHFGDKLGLYTEVLLQSVGPGQDEAIRKALACEAEPADALRMVIGAMVQRMCGADRLGLRFRLMAHEMAQPTPALSRVIDETVRPVYARLRQLVGSLIDMPADHDKTRLCAQSVVGQIAFYAHARPVLAHLWPELKMTLQRIEQITNHITEFSLVYFHQLRTSRGRPAGRQRAKGPK